MANFTSVDIQEKDSEPMLCKQNQDDSASQIVSELILGCPVSTLTLSEHVNIILGWARAKLSRFVCVANVHMLMEAHWNPDFKEILHNASLVTPDGMPLVWMLNLLLQGCYERSVGMDIFLGLCQHAQEESLPLYLLGSNPQTLELIEKRLLQEFPRLVIAGSQPLPYRSLTPEEGQSVIKAINQSGAGVVFVALGCPKQEAWMNEFSKQIRAVLIGVGAVFPIYAGLVNRAPLWMRRFGLEWLHRLLQEPRRLWRRYFLTIPSFIYLSLRQLLAHKIQHSSLSQAKFKSWS